LRVTRLLLPTIIAAAAIGAPSALAKSPNTGGSGVIPQAPASTPSQPTVAGSVAKIVHGVAYAPSLAPLQVKRAIWAGNKIDHTPYIFGGGHADFVSRGYDCSGSVSYVLHAAGLLKTPMDSSDFYSWGHRGNGHWITVYTNPGHAFVEIAGIRFDTAAEGPAAPRGTFPGTGPRWRPLMTGTRGFQARHYAGL
jgi:cell wall-associated NlpC family hydrolase